MDFLLQIGGRLPLTLSRQLGRALYSLLRNEAFSTYLRKRAASFLHKIGEIRKILVISDVNLGDAIIIQSCIEVLRHYFPDSEIDYAYNVVVDALINNNPEISNTFPIFTSSIKPSRRDRQLIQRLCEEKDYDLVVNFCPFLSGHDLKSAGCPALSPTLLIAEILKAKTKKNEPAHLGYMISESINQVFSEFHGNANSRRGKVPYSGAKLYLSNDALAARDGYLRSLGISPDDIIIFFNPDASNKYTFLDRDLQLVLLRELLSRGNFDFLLLGPGITFKGIERYLIDKIPASLRKKVVIVDKTLPIATYASLLDTCDLFVTGDTGPMHIAAARRVCANGSSDFKNCTGIVGIFGSSDPEVYGYDSFGEMYIGANQDAPSKVFEAKPVCKDLICPIQRITNTCSGGRCFDGLNIDGIVTYIARYLSSLKG